VYLEAADPTLARRPRLLLEAVVYHLVVFLLDVASMWALIRAVGAVAEPADVFASFMLSSLVRTVGFVPGGLGLYEAASILTLRLVGLSTATALAATLLFRGLSFWLPMVPGMWASREALGRRVAEASTSR
jgi:Mg2+-importing ATPase